MTVSWKLPDVSLNGTSYQVVDAQLVVEGMLLRVSVSLKLKPDVH